MIFNIKECFETVCKTNWDKTIFEKSVMSIRLEDEDSYETQVEFKPDTSLLYRLEKKLAKVKLFHIPILNWWILLTFIYLLYKLILKYEELYAKNVLFTTLIANVLLFGLSDTLAQNIVCFTDELRKAQLRRSRQSNSILIRFRDNEHLSSHNNNTDDDIYTDFGFNDIERTMSTSSINTTSFQHLEDQTNKDVFNFKRFVGFMCWGFIVSFFQVLWYKILNSLYTTEPTLVSVLERVMSDQLIYSPIFLFFFFAYSNFILENGNKQTFAAKISKIYFSTLMANYMLWPLVQFINFLIMPRRFQVPFSSSIGVLWNCFLSMRNASN